jgi:hypothetical protein
MTIHSFQPRHDQHRSATTWQMVLDSATNEHEVVQVARDFTASFTPHEIELMPEECRPGKLVDAEDVARYSYDLTVHRRGDADAGAALIEAFAHFFADASERLAFVTRTNPGDRETA